MIETTLNELISANEINLSIHKTILHLHQKIFGS
jgi:hypothetical protein